MEEIKQAVERVRSFLADLSVHSPFEWGSVANLPALIILEILGLPEGYLDLVKVLVLWSCLRRFEIEFEVDEVFIEALDVPGVVELAFRVVFHRDVDLDAVENLNFLF